MIKTTGGKPLRHQENYLFNPWNIGKRTVDGRNPWPVGSIGNYENLQIMRPWFLSLSFVHSIMKYVFLFLRVQSTGSSTSLLLVALVKSSFSSFTSHVFDDKFLFSGHISPFVQVNWLISVNSSHFYKWKLVEVILKFLKQLNYMVLSVIMGLTTMSVLNSHLVHIIFSHTHTHTQISSCWLYIENISITHPYWQLYKFNIQFFAVQRPPKR